MFCPRCGQQQISDETRFCSKCGFLMTGAAQLIANEGQLPVIALQPESKKDSPRRRGVKQGAMIMLVGCFLIVPIVGILSQVFGFPEELIGVIAVLGFCGGLIRMIYAALFEESYPNYIPVQAESARSFSARPTLNVLPPQQSIPIDAEFQGAAKWRETNEPVKPPSVTEHTTKLLAKDE
jgi:hypothetical protein